MRLGGTGLRTRPLRVFLSALGIAIGVAAMIAVVGISGSGRSEVDRRLDALGTNLLRVAPGDALDGTEAKLPHEAVAMIGRVPPVQQVAATGATAAHIYRNEHIAIGRTGSLEVLAAGRDLLPAVGGHVRRGRWLDSATEKYPAVVLGSTAAGRLDVYTPGTRVWLGGRWFSLVGVLDPVPLAPELDSAALVGWPAARTYLRFDGHPSTVYVRAEDSQVAEVRAVLPATAYPEKPGQVRISRPSDALAAREATESALTGLLLGLGGVALLVGGVGVATRWSSRSWSGARRSACAGRWGRPAARSGPSSSRSRCCCRSSAASGGRCWGPRSRRPTPSAATGRRSSRCGRVRRGSAARSSSA
ncbi:hypothetical protein STAFG_0557 [Streptomyces afghaniensis 772]|uniref:MacB-like periplasmic core domain-containing protein n=1 Tax=Streptomyces afghaniensis 772 TaxID=1283301 RepID=S4N129_9ACTN|nr:hypothetical protein STAFG_0557 [Streptomyces afghaniensis 772]